mmetsp:Transcript_27067/g.68103  ORF Transcript_27067/g.68103 Transcript_27067/m.68103 type:complete len:209 (-) Transcript_27067:1581-2207(-)
MANLMVHTATAAEGREAAICYMAVGYCGRYLEAAVPATGLRLRLFLMVPICPCMDNVTAYPPERPIGTKRYTTTCSAMTPGCDARRISCTFINPLPSRSYDDMIWSTSSSSTGQPSTRSAKSCTCCRLSTPLCSMSYRYPVNSTEATMSTLLTRPSPSKSHLLKTWSTTNSGSNLALAAFMKSSRVTYSEPLFSSLQPPIISHISREK